MEIKNYARCAFMAPDPKLMTIDLTEIERNQARKRADLEKANPPKPEPVRVVYNRLRQELYNLQQVAKNTEVFCNNKADMVKSLEERINVHLKEKKQAIKEGHLGQERMCEHRIQLLETELIDAKEEFTKAKHWSAQAARAFKAFEFANKERIAELKEQLDKPLVIK